MRILRSLDEMIYVEIVDLDVDRFLFYEMQTILRLFDRSVRATYNLFMDYKVRMQDPNSWFQKGGF